MATVRKNQKHMTSSEKQIMLAAIQDLVDNGEYGKLVAIHGDMKHRMHGTGMDGTDDPVGEQRFLPWHREFLLQLEKKLHGLSIPYWDWANDRAFPSWLKSFKPTVAMPDGSEIHVVRYSGRGGVRLPKQSAVTRALKLGDYTAFTETLEGLHNNVHMWTGGVSGNQVGTMGNIMISPADPIFWLHHSQIDRVWSLWQKDHAREAPDLAGPVAKLDPWTTTASKVEKVDALGYAYE
jgi:tyrosinase